ncbi:hypothetical protein BDY19DRAFT_998874 [Irpex rosettiformis]|uniref:Uncharacterized protein n=1 Tax=Irpex rosettiformis TaxID=378272 RepID=A0ACB8TM57_9APHY|nr:hypothetical protein BDY19DRAFT_998874 [Irpex rosettiformis]
MAGRRSSTKSTNTKTRKGRRRDRQTKSNNGSDVETPLAMASSPKRRSVPKVVLEPLSPQRRRQLRSAARAFVDEEALEDNERDKTSEDGEVDEENEEDKTFIDDASLRDNGDSSQESEIVLIDPPPQTPKGKAKASITRDLGEITDDSDEENVDLKTKPSKGKGKARVRRDDDEDVTAITKPSKGKAKVTVEYVEQKISRPGTSRRDDRTSPTVPIVDDLHNPFLNNDLVNPSSVAKSKDKRSPRKRTRVKEDLEENPSKRDDQGQDLVQETPVSKISRKMKSHTLEIEDPSSDRIPSSSKVARELSSFKPSSTPIVDQVSNVADPEHRKYMCGSLLDTYQGPLAPPVIWYFFG